MEILSTIWQIIWTLLLVAAATGSIILLVALLHPLRFDLRLRGSVRGQRAEVWFVYLFRMFKIGIIATPHTQDVVISFLGWKKRLERMSRQKPAAPPPDSPKPPATAEPALDKVTDIAPAPGGQQSSSSNEAENAEPAKPAADKVPEKPEVQTPVETASTTGSSRAETPAPAESTPPVVESPHKDSVAEPEIAAAETIEPVISQEQPVKDVDPRPLKPVAEVEKEYRAAREAETAAATPGKGPDQQGTPLKQILRKFKRDASRRFSQIKGYLRLFRRKWRALAPVFKRFWQRGKKGFGLPRIDLLLRYALHEPYLTGMSHATLAVASGMAGQWGINFLPVPHFGAPMLYSRAWITGVIRPWRLLFATAALFFEKQVYVELWQLFKWYRAKKQH